MALSVNTILLLAAVIIGVAHAAYAYRQEVALFSAKLRDHPREVRLRAAYFAFWALALWVVLGRYVVGYWLLAIVPYLAARAMGKTLGPVKAKPAR